MMWPPGMFQGPYRNEVTTQEEHLSSPRCLEDSLRDGQALHPPSGGLRPKGITNNPPALTQFGESFIEQAGHRVPSGAPGVRKALL